MLALELVSTDHVCPRWRLGDTLALNCSSPGSSPPAKLRYYINNMMDDGSHTVMSRLALVSTG